MVTVGERLSAKEREENRSDALEYMRYRGKDTPRRCFSP